MTAALSTTREIVASSILVTMADHKLTGKQVLTRLKSDEVRFDRITL
jgi:hypothetical protein